MVLELPEMAVIARQMKESLAGKRISTCICGHTPHKFAWYNHPVETFPDLLVGLRIQDVHSRGNYLIASLDSDRALVFGDVGGRIQLYPPGVEAPAKHQLLLGFGHGSLLAVVIVMWGSIQVLAQAEIMNLPYIVKRKIAPLEDEFTYEYFCRLVTEAAKGPKTSLKYMLVSEPGVAGIGNGCLQDILFNAGLHPRHPVISLTEDERQALYNSLRDTLRRMIDDGGRDNETNLFGKLGGYKRILGSHSVGKSCPRCDGIIEKAAYLGGTVYYCPVCQG
jgi:formamidopyrimidine-DNA glycosylase